MLLMGCGTPLNGPDSGKPTRVRAIYLYPSDARYPSELWNVGIQGDVELQVGLGADGLPTQVTLVSSSRSTELDQIAVGIGRDLKFKVNSPTPPAR